MTHWASRNTPISFFSPPKLKPVLPPTEASTIESNVVGILMKLMPRLKVEAAKPPRSVTIPPPRFIISEWRVAPPCCNASQTWTTLSRFFSKSPAPMVIIWAPDRHGYSLTSGQHFRSVVASVRTKSLSCFTSSIANCSSCSKFCDIMTFCFIFSRNCLQNYKNNVNFAKV